MLLILEFEGSQNAPLTGLYSYICKKYNLNFQRYRKSLEDIIDQVCIEYPDLSVKNKNNLYTMIPNIIDDGSEEEVIAKTRGMIKVMLGE